MTSHVWGDEWFEKHGDDLECAITECTRGWKRWGRIGSHGKEKYGTFRDHVYFYNSWWPIHSLVYPAYVYHQWAKKYPRLYWFELHIMQRVVEATRIYKLVHWYQKHVYNYFIQKVCKKYPDIVDEIVSDLDGYEMIRPGIFGKVDGVKIHNKYWTSFS